MKRKIVLALLLSLTMASTITAPSFALEKSFATETKNDTIEPKLMRFEQKHDNFIGHYQVLGESVILTFATAIEGVDHSNVTMPAKVNYNGKDYNVMGIGEFNTELKKGLKILTLEDGILSFDTSKFQFELLELNLPKSASVSFDSTLPDGTSSLPIKRPDGSYWVKKVNIDSNNPWIHYDAVNECIVEGPLPTPPVEPETPETEKPETEKPETEKPETEKPETEKPETEKPETEKPETEKPETEKPETEKPETEKPHTEKPQIKPETKPSVEDKKNETDVPKTGDPVSVGLMGAMLASSGAVIAKTLKKRK